MKEMQKWEGRRKTKITTLPLASRVKQVPLKRQRVLWRVLGVSGDKPVGKSRRRTDGDELGKEEPEEQKRGYREHQGTSVD